MKNYHITYSYKHQNNVVIVDCDIEEVHKADIKRGDTILLDNGDLRIYPMLGYSCRLSLYRHYLTIWYRHA